MSPHEMEGIVKQALDLQVKMILALYMCPIVDVPLNSLK
jgi:hypothetical protein